MLGTEGQYLGLFEGSVTNRDDPSGRGRIKFRIPGMIEPESPNWAEPIGSIGGGHAQRGTIEPPAIGANVDVFFVMGSLTKPRYLPGPWGEPDGVSDSPAGAAVEGDDRQNAVTEDEEWSVQRDSRTTSKKYVIQHKSSSLTIVIDASADKVFLVDDAADQALVRGTEYRAAETSYMSALHSAVRTFGNSVKTAIDIAELNAAGTTLVATLDGITETDYRTDDTAYLSEKAFTE